MMTINDLPNAARAEIFANIPDTRLRLVCKAWKATFDSPDFKTMMGKIYDKWLSSPDCFWEPVQLKWQAIFGQPAPFDSQLCGNVSWAEKMEKITRFIFLINPAMIAFFKKYVPSKPNPIQDIALKALKQRDMNEYKELMVETRLNLRNECFLTVLPKRDDQLIAQRKKKPGMWQRVGEFFVHAPKAVESEVITGNLSTDSLRPKLGSQFFVLTWIESRLNQLLS